MMRLRIVLLASLLCVLAACASKDEKKIAMKPAKLVDFDTSVGSKKLWSVSAGKGQDKRHAKLVPAVNDGAVFVSDVEGNVFSYDLETRKKRWSTKTEKAISASVTVNNGNVYFGTYDGELVALDAATGDVRWQASVSSEILSLPAANRSVVIVQTIDGRLFGINAEDGEPRWRYDHTVPRLTIRGNADPVLARGQVIAAFDNGQLVALNAEDGSLIWNGRVSQPKGNTELDKIVDIDGTPIIDGSLVYAANYHGAIAAYSKTKGKIIWKQDVSTHQSLALAGNRIFVVTEESHIHAYNASSGALEWKNEQLHRRDLGSPIVIDNHLAVIDKDDHLHVLNQSDGGFARRFKVSGDRFRSPMVAFEGGFLVLSGDGKLSAYQLEEK